jgi:glycosyltransferase involved in cell wall biosynthesis
MININNPDYTINPASRQRVKIRPCLLAPDASPVLTIITPFFNTGLIFHETAQCILNQSLQQWEWLIINDGSTNAQCLEMLAEYRHTDPRIRVIDHPNNRGLSAARNTGFLNARCELVLVIDSDDLLEPTAAEKWWWYLETHPLYSFVASYHIAFGGKNFLWTGGFHDGTQNTERNRVSMMCVIRKSVHEAVGGFDETILGGLEDWDFWMRCADHGYWGATIPEYLAWYRLRKDHSDRWKNLQEAKLNEFQKILKEKYPKLYQGGFPKIDEYIDYDLTLVDLCIPDFNRLNKTYPHLLLILPWLSMGGAERFSLNLIDQLIQKGWTISILTTSPSDNLWLYEFEKRTPFVYILPNFIPIKDYPRFIGYLIQSQGCDAILLQGSREGYRLLPTIKTFFPNIPILDYLHFVTPEWMQGGFPKLSILYKDLIDFTFTSCAQVRDWMINAGADAERLQVCYIGVDTDIWKPDPTARKQLRNELGIGADETIVLFAARLENQKQPDVYAETLFKLLNKGDKFYGLVAGEGSLREELERKLHAYNLASQVRFLGNVPTEKMPTIMAASDIFFLPSQNEGVSQALFEAMASGLVFVGAQVGGQAEVITAECGILSPLGDRQNVANEYADIMHSLINDGSRRQQLGITSRQRVLERFTLPSMAEIISEKLLAAIEKEKSSLKAPLTEPEKQSINRETRILVEYLQTRRELKTVNRQLSTLVIPHQPSHWFYLWIRQLFLPVSERINHTFLGKIMVGVQKWLKQILIKSS